MTELRSAWSSFSQPSESYSNQLNESPTPSLGAAGPWQQLKKVSLSVFSSDERQYSSWRAAFRLVASGHTSTTDASLCSHFTHVAACSQTKMRPSQSSMLFVNKHRTFQVASPSTNERTCQLRTTKSQTVFSCLCKSCTQPWCRRFYSMYSLRLHVLNNEQAACAHDVSGKGSSYRDSPKKLCSWRLKLNLKPEAPVLMYQLILIV